MRVKEFLLLFSSRNQQISSVRERGERSRRHTVLRHVSDCLVSYLAGFWSHRPWATARLGRESFVFIVLGNAEPRLGKCNDLRLFCFLTKNGMVPC